MISLGPGLKTSLSGAESRAMTHYLRMNHDAILIGAGTAAADNPSLNCRYPDARQFDQPRPIIVGSQSLPEDWLQTCKATALAKYGDAKHPWMVRADHKPENRGRRFWDGNTLSIGVDIGEALEWEVILSELYKRDIKTVMIEGGGRVIKDLLRRDELVNMLITTTAPVLLGDEGVQASPRPAYLKNGKRTKAAVVLMPKYFQFGDDMVMCGRLYPSFEHEDEESPDPSEEEDESEGGSEKD